jgi:hypothetical protein
MAVGREKLASVIKETKALKRAVEPGSNYIILL